MATPKVWCLLIDQDNKPRGSSFKVEVKEDIADWLKEVKNEHPSVLENISVLDLIVWRCKDRKTVFNRHKSEEQVRNAFNDGVDFLEETEEMENLSSQRRRHYSCRCPSCGNPNQALESGGSTRKTSLPSVRGSVKDSAQERDVEAARQALPPSSAAAMPAFKAEQEKRPVLNGRPHHNYGPPVGLFHPVFNSFQAAMTSSEHFYADDAETYATLRSLFRAFADIYATKEQRTGAIEKHLSSPLGAQFVVVDAPGVKSDGVIIHPCGRYYAYTALREDKNEIGTGNSDPYNQASLAYRKYWAQPSRESDLFVFVSFSNLYLLEDVIRSNSYCPSIILSIVGPWLCVLGAVYLEQVVIQPLTDYVWLGGDYFNDDRLLFASRLFASLKTTIFTLQSYYETLGSGLLTIVPRNDAFPYITKFDMTKFMYLSRLAPDSPNKLLYRASLENKKQVVVKFVSTYHAQSHRILAEHQLAPKLLYASTDEPKGQMYGGRYMIVMDFVEGRQAVDSLSDPHFKQVEQAIQLLHMQDLVFGDLRPPNILIMNGKVMIVDFDWCGKAGEARYPPSLNIDKALGWHTGVGPDSVMKKAHDLFMLAKLKPHQT
ncbi:hypothetical protein DXG01_012884 [Tephrocybe rancida]|nr:hypothetical protein DXG01_012884 [Tephrocybe rancida]